MVAIVALEPATITIDVTPTEEPPSDLRDIPMLQPRRPLPMPPIIEIEDTAAVDEIDDSQRDDAGALGADDRTPEEIAETMTNEEADEG